MTMMENPSTCDVCKLVDGRDASCDGESASERDHHGFLTHAMRAAEEAALQVRCAIAPLESHAEMIAAARALASVAEAREAVRQLARAVMLAQGHSV